MPDAGRRRGHAARRRRLDKGGAASGPGRGGEHGDAMTVWTDTCIEINNDGDLAVDLGLRINVVVTLAESDVIP